MSFEKKIIFMISLYFLSLNAFSQEISEFVKVTIKNGITQIKKADGSQNIIENKDLGPTLKFNFNDKKDISNFDLVIFPSFKSINDYIDEGLKDAKGTNFLNRYTYALKEGLGGKKLDFLTVFENGGLVYFDGKLYNGADFGNMMWGAAMARLGFTYAEVKIGSECNGLINTYSQNAYIEKPWYGLCLSGDTKEDQAAIKDGFYGPLGKASNLPLPSCSKNTIGYGEGIKNLFSLVVDAFWGVKSSD